MKIWGENNRIRMPKIIVKGDLSKFEEIIYRETIWQTEEVCFILIALVLKQRILYLQLPSSNMLSSSEVAQHLVIKKKHNNIFLQDPDYVKPFKETFYHKS